MGMTKLPKRLLKALFPSSKKKSTASTSTASTTATPAPTPTAASSSSSKKGKGGGNNNVEVVYNSNLTPPPPPPSSSSRREVVNANTTNAKGGASVAQTTYEEFLDSITDPILGPLLKNGNDNAIEQKQQQQKQPTNTKTTTTKSSPVTVATDLITLTSASGDLNEKVKVKVKVNVNENENEISDSHADWQRGIGSPSCSSAARPSGPSTARTVTPEPEAVAPNDSGASVSNSNPSSFISIDNDNDEQRLHESEPQATTSVIVTPDSSTAAPATETDAQPFSPAKTTTAPKKVQFSTRGEEARQRAVARQKKILSKASLRLDAISDTSLENIQEATTNNAANNNNNSNSKEMSSKDGVVVVDEFPSPAPKRPGTANTDAAITATPLRVKVLEARLEAKNARNGNISSFVSFDSPTSLSCQGETEEVAVKQLSVDVGAAKLSLSSQLQQAMGDGPAKALFPIAKPDDNVTHAEAQQSSTPGNTQSIQFFILLLCPTSRIFELIEISAIDTTSNNSTVADVLKLIPQKCTDERLLNKEYLGFVRPSDRVDFVDVDAKAFEVKHDAKLGGNEENEKIQEDNYFSSALNNFINEDDVLVAILDGYSGYQMAKISKPILRNSKFRDMIRRRSHKGNADGCGLSRRDSSNSLRSLRSNKSSRSMMSNKSGRSSRRRKKKSGSSTGGNNNRDRSGSVSSSRSSRRIVSAVPEEVCCDDDDSKKRMSKSKSSKDGEKGNNDAGDNKYSSLCQKLEHLSKKLHDVDDEIIAGDVSVSGASMASFPVPEETAATVLECVNEDNEEVPELSANLSSEANNFKMTPQMVAYELAANIEDIFAGHDVEIVAVDGDLEEDSDDDTFVSARSSRSMKSMKSVRSLIQHMEQSQSNNKLQVADAKPLFEIVTKKKPPRKPRVSKFDTFGEDDMMLQIEAMAAQADMAFENIKKKRSQNDGGAKHHSVVIEPVIESVIIRPSEKIHVIEEIEGASDEGSNAADKEMAETEAAKANQENVEDAVKSNLTMAESPSTTVNSPLFIYNNLSSSLPGNDNELDTPTHSNTLSSRSFLNASTSMVSTMVAASQGRVNEVHVLQYLGVTIVCIAANFMQQAKANGMAPRSPSFGAKEVFESAMFLAFMVNGQRYLAKVTKK